MGEIQKKLEKFGVAVTGLKAGTTYKFTYKLGAKVDNAKKSARHSKKAAEHAKKGHAALKQVKETMKAGDFGAARAMFQSASGLSDEIKSCVEDAEQFAQRADEDWQKAAGSLKQAYETAKKGAEEAFKHAGKLLGAYEDLARSVGAALEEHAAR